MSAPARSDTAWDTAWEAALTALELDVEAAEAMLRLDHAADAPPASPWQPPVGLPPLPVALVERATALLQRQVEVATRLAEAAAMSRRHHRAVDALRAAAPSSPVYVDTPL